MSFLHDAQKNKADGEGQETGRSFVHNRLPNICFTRDRLLYYEIQRLASARNKLKRQAFAFEIAYFLNFYYPVIYGGLDQLALVVSQILKLGIPDKNVGATYRAFLDPLQTKNSALYAVFTEPGNTEFMKRIGALRHFASHRGSLMPTKIIEKPDKEPTDEELDKEILDAGMDDILNVMPEGEMRENFREMLRYNFRMAHYEEAGTVVDGVVPITLDGKSSFIRPALDTSWNFQKFMIFVNQVFAELNRCL